MKKGTLALLSNLEGENICRKVMLEGAMNGGLGVAAGSLPRHISLGMPYYVTDYDAYLNFAEEYAKQLLPVKVTLTGMISNPIGTSTGAYLFEFSTDTDIEKLRANTREQLRSKLQLHVPEKDGVTGKQNITLGFGKAPFDAYKAYVDQVQASEFIGKELIFDELGVFYYDEETIAADNFFCCKRIKL